MKLPARHIAALALAALVLALALAGCGDDDTEMTTAPVATSADMSRDLYVRQVHERCDAYIHERRRLEQPLQDAGDPTKMSEDELQDVADEIMAVDNATRGIVADTAAIPRPEDDAAELETIFGHLNEMTAALDDADAAAQA